jgi:CDP-diacylglycerol--serine O-phosphatidyltransferase
MTEKIPSKRGIYLLPSVLTTFGMFAGFYSIISSINGDFTIAAISILIAMFWDTLDGRVARLTNTQSAFGAEYDSLADLVSFGWLQRFLYTSGLCMNLEGLDGWQHLYIWPAQHSDLQDLILRLVLLIRGIFKGFPLPQLQAL